MSDQHIQHASDFNIHHCPRQYETLEYNILKVKMADEQLENMMYTIPKIQ